MKLNLQINTTPIQMLHPNYTQWWITVFLKLRKITNCSISMYYRYINKKQNEITRRLRIIKRHEIITFPTKKTEVKYQPIFMLPRLKR
jgi:hypothetical protein